MSDPMTATTLRAAGLSATQIAETLISLIETREAEVRAFAHYDPDQLRLQAGALDARRERGPLHGIPIGVKDVILTRDMPTEHNTARYLGSRPGIDAACVDTLRAAGAMIVGKTVTTEFAATARGGKTRNPHDLSRTPGGSSSGSAAAVAAGMATIALGTQTGGSTIRPASYNGIFGWKPTWNTISREGLKMYSATCDTLGLYSRDAADLELLADVFGFDLLADMPTGLEGLKVGFVRTPTWDRTETSVRTAMSEAIALLEGAGATVSELVLPPLFDDIHEAHKAILDCEGRSAFLSEVRNTPDIHDEFLAKVENRRGETPESLRAAYRLADECRGAYDDIAAGFDIVMTPSATSEAPVGLDSTGDASMNSMWTLLQVPVVSAPGLKGPSGMPIGVSFVARRYEDRRAIAVAGFAAKVLSSAVLETA
ncbi:amidase [Pseudooceanicola sp.]|uniref:amidase n=1 Tax=Pseudooceanicola sp. TaxID=1914328 RepID=UPI002620F005|nr:amidase [Pseudooceanicola sp.]MDF1857037.1 amidase [Pseudooceanicola sp.]